MKTRMTFESFDLWGSYRSSPSDRESLVRAKRAAQEFAANPQGWLLLTGPRGCGKTHLAIAIASESERQGRSTFYAFVPSLLDHLRATFSPDSPIGYDELFEQVQTTSLLVLDDLGAESSTPWAEEKLYQVVVYRYDRQLPTVITSFLEFEDLRNRDQGIGSRLIDGSVVDWHDIKAPNYRNPQRPS